ncbi:hypothetical protein SMJ63A_10353 [Stenotrophomonas geniculata]
MALVLEAGQRLSPSWRKPGAISAWPQDGTREQRQKRVASLEAEHGSALQKLTAQRCRAWPISAAVTASTH